MKSEIQLFTHTVLIVDDEQVNREMLGNILQDQYDILYAIDGKQALEILEREGENISLVLLDLLMPNMSGGEVLKQMNRNGMIKNIPVIVLTSDKSSEIVSLKTGAADFLTKPYDSSEVILARVKHSIELFENTKIIKATGFDSLTRLYTGDFFLQYAALIDRKYPNSEMDSIVINFSKFHLLNELKGRSFGNEVLLAISQGIKNSLKKLNGIASRVNADTFYIYANHTDNLKYYLVNIKKELRELLKEPEMRFRLGYFVDKDHEFSVQKRFDYAIQACNSIRNQANKEIAVYDKSLADKDKIDAMLLRYKNLTDFKEKKSLENEIIVEALPLVRKISSHLARRSTDPIEDILQVGILGLIKSVKMFDISKSQSFRTYATYFITGEIRHYLRDKVAIIKAPREIYELAYRVHKVVQELKETDGEIPSEEKIASELNTHVDKVREVIEVEKRRHVLSLEQIISYMDSEIGRAHV